MGAFIADRPVSANEGHLSQLSLIEDSRDREGLDEYSSAYDGDEDSMTDHGADADVNKFVPGRTFVGRDMDGNVSNQYWFFYSAVTKEKFKLSRLGSMESVDSLITTQLLPKLRTWTEDPENQENILRPRQPFGFLSTSLNCRMTLPWIHCRCQNQRNQRSGTHWGAHVFKSRWKRVLRYQPR